MEHIDNSQSSEYSAIWEKLGMLERRLSGIESHLKSAGAGKENNILFEESTERPVHRQSKEKINYESTIGQYGLAWIGSVVLLFGISFMMNYIQVLGYQLWGSVLGYAAVALIFLAAYFLRKSYTHLVFLLRMAGLILLYYTSLRLHFFGEEPLLSSVVPALFIVLLVSALQVYFALRYKSELYGLIGMLMFLVSAMAADQTHLSLPLAVLAVGVSLLLFIRAGWWRLLVFGLITVYFIHLLWMISNPLAGNELVVVETHQYNLTYLFAYYAIFNMPVFLGKRMALPENFINVLILLNSFAFSLLLTLNVILFFINDYVWIFSIVFVFAFTYAVLIKSRTRFEFAPAFYACFSFLALSLAIYGMAVLSNVFLLLSLQSLLVVSMALWFRSRIIVVMNTLLFLAIVSVYLLAGEAVVGVEFTMAFVALATARVLNWKKERLALKTETFRNIYLLIAFVTVLNGLYHAMPEEFVTLSWALAAGIYFLVSILMKNIKYRWMAIATLIVAAVYLFAVDLSNMAIGIKVVAFMGIAVISIAASLYYTRSDKNKKIEEGGESDPLP